MKKQERPTEEGRTPQQDTSANERPEPHHHPAGEAAVPQQDVAAEPVSEGSGSAVRASECVAAEGSADHTAAAAARFSGLRERLAARRQALLRRIEYRRLKRIR